MHRSNISYSCYLCLLIITHSYNTISVVSFTTPSIIETSSSFRTRKNRTIINSVVASLDDNSSSSNSNTKLVNSNNEIIQNLSPLSLTSEELGNKIGGIGRAKVSWDCYRIGVDPLQYYDPINKLKHENEENKKIQSLLTPRRRTDGLGIRALIKLKDLLPNNNNGSSGSNTIEESIATISHISTSSDGTTKLLCRLQKDGLEVETVIIPWYGERNSSTLCISSQVGCKQACTFCATGKYFKRSLTSDEILCQVFLAKKICRLSLSDTNPLPNIDNVVFMGMGEPADNAVNVVKAATILTDRNGFQLAQSKVTISTVAPSPDVFMQLSKAPCVLAWSVHAVNEKLRKTLVPTTKYSMIELRQGLINTLIQRPKKLRTTMLEIALIHNMNDSIKDANELADFVNVMFENVPNMKLIVNLIPWNDIISMHDYEKPSYDDVLAFQNQLISRGVFAFIRTTRGDDIAAACGQLARNKKKNVVVAAE